MKNKKPIEINPEYLNLGITNSFLAEKQGVSLKALYGLNNHNKSKQKVFISRVFGELPVQKQEIIKHAV